MLIADWVKLLVSRPRPPVEHLQAVTGSSFPSGHATQAGAFWFSLVLALRTAGAPPTTTGVAAGFALLVVLVVAASRVYLGVHYPSDVVAGVLLGTGWALYVSHCLRRRRFSDDVASRPAPGPPTDEALVWDSLTRTGSHPHRHHAGGELLATVACARRRARGVRRGTRAEGGMARPRCHRDRGGGSQRPGKAARAPTSALLAVAPDAHSHTAVDVVSVRP